MKHVTLHDEISAILWISFFIHLILLALVFFKIEDLPRKALTTHYKVLQKLD